MESYSEGWWGEGGEKQAPGPYFDFRESGLEQVRNWIRKQRFIPCDLCEDFDGLILYSAVLSHTFKTERGMSTRLTVAGARTNSGGATSVDSIEIVFD